jgi:hypothetical protein
MLARWGDSALTEVEWLVNDGTTFELSQYVGSLPDSKRTSFAGRVGAGVTDLLMNALGYAWRRQLGGFRLSGRCRALAEKL